MAIFLNKNQVCDELSLSPSKIDRLRREGRFPRSIKVDGNVRWLHSDLVKWAENIANTEPRKKRGRPRLAV